MYLYLYLLLYYCYVEGRGYGSANGEKGGSSSRERPPYESGSRGGRKHGMFVTVIYASCYLSSTLDIMEVSAV